MSSNQTHRGVTRSVHHSTSLHFNSLADFRHAGEGKPVLTGQTAEGLDNGYGLQGNPTAHELQDALSYLEHGNYTLLFPSGLTALTALAALLNRGDHWLLPDTVYAPVQRFAHHLYKRYGIAFDQYDPADLTTVEKAVTPQTKLIHMESPCSVTFEVTDIDKVVKLAKKQGIITSADNTWASGALYQPLDHGVDISILSLTKYITGYSDVFMGSVTTRDERIFKELAYHHRVLGYTVAPQAIALALRGLESLKIRLAAHADSARQLIEATHHHKAVSKLHTVEQKNDSFHGTNGLFSLELNRHYSDDELEKPLAKLSTFTIGESWGGTRSLVLPFQPDELSNRFRAPSSTILRFHAGLEDIKQQIHDVNSLLSDLVTE